MPSQASRQTSSSTSIRTCLPTLPITPLTMQQIPHLHPMPQQHWLHMLLQLQPPLGLHVVGADGVVAYH